MTFEPVRPRSRRRRLAPLGGGVAAFVAAVAIAGGIAARGTDPAPDRVGADRAADRSLGQATGTATAAGVVVDGADIALGQVPLDVTVEPSWTLLNTSDRPVVLGQPHAEVLAGCCPGPLELGTTTLAPGELTGLVFPLQMHPGMDGPHDFTVHVPVSTGTRTEVLTLAVSGDFRD